MISAKQPVPIIGCYASEPQESANNCFYPLHIAWEILKRAYIWEQPGMPKKPVAIVNYEKLLEETLDIVALISLKQMLSTLPRNATGAYNRVWNATHPHHSRAPHTQQIEHETNAPRTRP